MVEHGEGGGLRVPHHFHKIDPETAAEIVANVREFFAGRPKLEAYRVTRA